MPPHPTSWRYALILSSHLHLGLPSGLFPSCFPTKTLYTHLLSPILAPLLRSYQRIRPGPRLSVWTFRNLIRFYGEELLAPRPTPKLEDHTVSAVRICLFNIFAPTLHIGGRSSIRSLRIRHASLQRPTYHGHLVLVRRNRGSFGYEVFTCY